MRRDSKTQREKVFLSLPREERETIISHGTAIRLSNLKKQLFLAESKVRHYEEKYKVTIVQMDAEGLPDNAGCEVHEDYIMWHHWADVSDKVNKINRDTPHIFCCYTFGSCPHNSPGYQGDH